MEHEEQKPKDIILNGEIKREVEDYLENVKEEPIKEEEYSEQIQKQKTDELLKNVKTEPIDEEYSEEIILKLEEVMEPSASELHQELHAKNPVQMFFTETKIVVSKLDVKPERDQEQLHVRSQKNHNNVLALRQTRCSVCLHIYPRQNMKHVTLEEDKFVIMVGCVLHGSYTIDQAQLFMSARKKLGICYVHFSEAINEIYQVLNIENANEITSCSSELMNHLMNTVNVLYPLIETEQFCENIYKFVGRNFTQKRKRGNAKKDQKKQLNRRCTVCSQLQLTNNLKNVSLQDDEIVIMIGCVLRGEYTLVQALSFISRKKCSLVCLIHFSQSIDEILKFLHIEHPDEISSCSTERMGNLMVTVNKLCSLITTSQFSHIFDKFVTKNKTLITITPTKIESEEQKPKDIILNQEIKQEMEDYLENVKDEPIDEEYSEQMVPRLEELMKPSASDLPPAIQLSCPVQKFTKAQKIFSTMDVEPQNKNNFSGIVNLQCSVCLQKFSRQTMKDVRMEEDKIVIMVGCILNGTYTIDQAQLFMSERRRLNICYVHFSESISKIYNVLNIKNNVEITPDVINNLMVTVTALGSHIENSQFCDILHSFVRRNISQKRREYKTKEELNRKQPNYHCSVCTQKQCSKNMKRVSLEDEKLIIMIACIIRGEYTLEQSHSFISQIKLPSVCHIHFSEALNEICKALNIKNSDEVYSCSEELMANLMVYVNELCPQLELWQFQTSLKKFFTRNRHLL